ncbi:hypothetical protein [Actinacidiphila soli]|uniref:hypothetical protein n=1 Tax=Actinacidiphila soli TaxID=2487275 RepID=UPI000FCB2E82|nr:hypothetical protein [Actinacidiphila soli]
MVAADGGGSSRLKPDTPFNQKGLKDLKAMLEDVKVQTVEDVAQNWLDVHDLLVGTDGQGGILKQFTDAVSKVLETWHGDSAMGFASEANKISQSFVSGAPYAKGVSDVLFSAAQTLQDTYGQVMAIQEPSLLDSGLDYLGNTLSSGAGAAGLISNTILPGSGGVVSAIGGMFGMSTGRDETQLNADLANPNISTAQALNNNRGQISEEKERSLEAAVHMENLALVYKGKAQQLKQPTLAHVDQSISEQKDGNGNGNTTGVGTIAAVPVGVSSPSSTAGTYKASTSTGSGYTPITATSPNATEGISGGSGSGSTPKFSTSTPSIGTGGTVGTGLDSFGTGSSGGSSSLGGVGGSYGGVGSTGSSVGSGSSSLGGGTGSGTSGVPGVSGSTVGGSAAGRTGAGSGRMGTPGMGGAAGAGKGGAGGSTGRGALARQKGGVVGAAKGKSGSGAQGGSGLHRSRGGTQAGTGSKSGRGMAGAPGAHGRGKGDEEGREGQRPDYLIEDEETWTPERNVAPRVIE